MTCGYSTRKSTNGIKSNFEKWILNLREFILPSRSSQIVLILTKRADHAAVSLSYLVPMALYTQKETSRYRNARWYLTTQVTSLAKSTLHKWSSLPKNHVTVYCYYYTATKAIIIKGAWQVSNYSTDDQMGTPQACIWRIRPFSS